MRKTLVLLAALGAARAVARRRRAARIDLSGQVALITGGSRGLGLALAEELALHDCKLIICGRDERQLQRAQRHLERRGAQVLAVACDVSDRAAVERLVAAGIERFGRVDILVNNAGIISVGPLDAQAPADFERAMEVMFWGTFWPTMAVLPWMRERGEGRIVNITSVGGKVSVPHMLPYSCAKFAAVGFSEGLRAELAGEGVTVTTVVPGLMRTGSYLNGEFAGRPRGEFTWFGVLANLPLTSIDARAAARQIVRSTQLGDAELIVTWQARLASRVHGLAPGVTGQVLGVVDRMLPSAPPAGGDKAVGWASETALTRSFLTALGRNAAAELLQMPETAPDSRLQSIPAAAADR